VDIGRAYTELAAAFATAGDAGRAREIYELAVDLLRDGPHRYRDEASRRFADLLERLGDADRAAALRSDVGA
jgi:hypothetical protein